MKVAVLSPQPRMSGVVTYSHHVARGFRDLGHECQVVTFTLSGKPSVSFKVEEIDEKRSGWGWSVLGFDRCEKWDDAAAVLSEYDVVLMEEPRCAPLDKRAMRKIGGGDVKVGREKVLGWDTKESDLPRYITALSQLRDTKLAVTLHDPGYGPRLAPFLDHFMSAATPDLIVTHRAGSLESAAWALNGVPTPELRIPHLPYKRSGTGWNVKPRPVVAMTGRYINNKGQPTLALAAAIDAFDYHIDTQIAGASPLGAGPNHTFLTYEGLLKRGFSGERDGLDVTRGWQWRAWSGERNIAYVGPYMDPVNYLEGDPTIHVAATDAAFSGTGSIEYVTLEAMDAGLAIVIPDHAVPKIGAPLTQVFNVKKLANAELTPVDSDRLETARSLGMAVNQAGVDTEMREHNWKIIEDWHSPAKYAAKILEAL